MVLENYAGVLAIAATIMGSFMSLGYFPQIHKILKRKSVEDISLPTFLILFSGLVVWLLYGLSINSYPLIIANSIGLIGTLLIIILYFRYKR